MSLYAVEWKFSCLIAFVDDQIHVCISCLAVLYFISLQVKCNNGLVTSEIHGKLTCFSDHHIIWIMVSTTSPIIIRKHPTNTSTLLPESQPLQLLPSTFHVCTLACNNSIPSHPSTNSSMGGIHSLIHCCTHKLPPPYNSQSSTLNQH